MALALGNNNHSNDSSSTRAITLSAGSGSVIIVVITTNGGPITGITSANGETVSLHATHTVSGANRLEMWSCVTSSAWSANSVTVTNTSAAYTTVDIFEVQGADTSNIFDDNASIPDVAGTEPRTISTDLADTFIIGAFRYGTFGTPAAGSGYTFINAADFQSVEYKIVSATQSSLSVNEAGTGTANAAIATAIRMAGAGTNPKGPLGLPFHGPFGGPI